MTMVMLAPFIELKKQEHAMDEIGHPVCMKHVDPSMFGIINEILNVLTFLIKLPLY